MKMYLFILTIMRIIIKFPNVKTFKSYNIFYFRKNIITFKLFYRWKTVMCKVYNIYIRILKVFGKIAFKVMKCVFFYS